MSAIQAPVTTDRPRPSGISRALAFAYALLIVYGSLYPFTGWVALPREEAWSFLTAPWPRYIVRSDLITNVLIYLPLGLLIARALRGRLNRLGAVVTAVLLGVALSFAMESLQTFLPGRVSSRVDLLMNGLGSLGGALLAGLFQAGSGPLARLAATRREWFRPGRLADLGLVVFGLWTLSQLTPLLLALDTGNLRPAGLPLWTPGYPTPFNNRALGAYALSVGGLGLFATLLGRRGRPILPLFAALAALVLLTKIAVMGRFLSQEMASGGVLGVVLATALGQAGRGWRTAAAGLSISAGFTLMELEPEPDALPMALEAFNWIPFRGQMHSLSGFSEILSLFWPFVLLGCLAVIATGGRRWRWALGGALLVLAMMLALEWQQQFIPGRRADITDVLLALAGWLLPWWRRFYDGRKELDGQPARTDQ